MYQESKQKYKNPLEAAVLGFAACPACLGYGFLTTPGKQNIFCKSCHAKKNLVATFGNKVLYWDRRMCSSLLLEEKVTRFVKNVRIGILSMIASVGFVMFVWQFWIIAHHSWDFTELLTTRSFELMIFYISLLFDLYMWYLFYREKLLTHHIPWRSASPADFLEDFSHEPYENLMQLPHSKQLEISQFFSQEAQEVLEESFYLAGRLGHATIQPVHLLGVLMPTSKVRLIFGRLAVSPQDIVDRTQNLLSRIPSDASGEPWASFKWYQILFVAYREAFLAEREQIEVTDILFALVKADKKIHDIFYDVEIDLPKLRHVSEWIYEQRKLIERLRHWRSEASLRPTNSMNRAMTARPTKVLDSMSRDITLLAGYGKFYPLIGRKSELDAMFRTLKEVDGSVLLIGAPGVGKTAMIQGLAEKMVAEEVPEILKDKRLVALDIGALLAGAGTGVGGVEQRMLEALNEATSAGNVILVVEDIASLFTGAGGVAAESANILVNFISQGQVKVIATASVEDYMRYLENNTGFLRRFAQVKLEEPDFDLTMRILQSRSGVFEYRQKVYFTYNALEDSIKLSAKYVHDRYLPEKAIDVLQQSSIIASETRGINSIVTQKDVAEIISKMTHIEVKAVSQEEGEKLLNLEDAIHERMIDQEEAVSAVSSALRRARQELRDEKRPIANFLFLGPTGVGKTELAKTVTEVYFGDEKRMVRLDMSEYQDKQSLYRLIGSPQHTEGEKGGYLTEAVRQSPFTVLLLDELEKAHPDILNVFLQVMDDGRLTDSLGRTVDFTQTIIIATSNAGAIKIQEDVKNNIPIEQIKNNLLEKELNQYFRPEFINRFDAVVVFKPLSKDDVYEIAKLMLKRVAKELEAKGINFTATDSATRELALKGFDPKFGARPLRRVIQNDVEDALAKMLLKGKISRRDQVVLQRGGELTIEKAEEL